MDSETVFYFALSILMPIIGFSALPAFGKGIFPLLAMVILILGIGVLLLMNFADSAVFSFATDMLGITFQPASNYKIVKGQDAVLKNVRGLYYATGFLTANLFPYYFKQEETAAVAGDTKLLQAPENWERALMNIGFPFKYHVLSTGLDVQEVRDELEGKRSFQEFQLSRAMQSTSSNEVTLTDLRRKINVIQSKIDRISQGERPVATLMYFETTAVGVSEKAALDALSTQLRALQISMGSLDVDLARIVGRELYTLFRFNFALPTTFNDIAMQFDQQS